jgi:uncharacterized protein (TIRG00374 family)
MGLADKKSILVKGLFIFIGLSILIMVGILIWTTEEETWRNLINFKLIFVPLLLGLAVVRWLIDGMAFVTMAKHGSGTKLHPVRAAVIRLEGNLIADVIPLFIGIFSMHAYMLHKEKLNLSESIAIAASRAMIPIFLFLMNIPILFFMRADPNSGKLFAKLIEVISIPMVVAVLFIVIALFFPARIKALVSKSVRWWGRVKFVHIERILSLENRLFHEIDQFSRILRIYIKEKTHMFLRATGWILLTFLADSMFAMLIMWGFGYHPPLLRVIAYQFLIWPIWYLSPLPGQAGVFEFSYLGFFSLFMPSSVIGLAVVMERLMFTYLPMIAGFYFLLREFRRDKRFKDLVFEKGILEAENIEDVRHLKI